jgi:hypothetical protein
VSYFLLTSSQKAISQSFEDFLRESELKTLSKEELQRRLISLKMMKKHVELERANKDEGYSLDALARLRRIEARIRSKEQELTRRQESV